MRIPLQGALDGHTSPSCTRIVSTSQVMHTDGTSPPKGGGENDGTRNCFHFSPHTRTQCSLSPRLPPHCAHGTPSHRIFGVGRTWRAAVGAASCCCCVTSLRCGFYFIWKKKRISKIPNSGISIVRHSCAAHTPAGGYSTLQCRTLTVRVDQAVRSGVCHTAHASCSHRPAAPAPPAPAGPF